MNPLANSSISTGLFSILCFSFSDEGVRSATPKPVSREFAPFFTSFFDSDFDWQVSSKPVGVSMAVPYFERTNGLVRGDPNLTRLLAL